MNKGRKLSNLQELLPTNLNKVEVHSRTVNSYFTILGEEGVGSPEDHYDQLETLKHANQGELFVCTISSCPGGNFSGLLAWKNALEGTQAHTVAILEGDLASAGTILPNFFDEIHVTPYTTYMMHSANLGIHRNTSANVERNAAFQAKQMERFLREVYEGFLTEVEIQKVLDGVELYMNDDEVQERLDNRREFLSENSNEEACVPCDETCSNIDNPCKECLELPEIKLEEENIPPVKKSSPSKKSSTKKAKALVVGSGKSPVVSLQQKERFNKLAKNPKLTEGRSFPEVDLP